MRHDTPILLLITASAPHIQQVRRARVLNFQQITMPYLAAFAPPHWTVRHVDEAVEPVNLDAPADLVAITFHTPSAPHAYALAGRFRQRGTTVVLGGPHVTLLPEEAQAHADVIFVGEAEPHWPQFLAEFEAGRRIHAHGIAVQAGIVFGFDHDTAAVFEETLDFLEEAGVQNATFNILTPFPGTPLHMRLEAEGRILTRDWTKYNGRADVVFRPQHMSPEALLAGYQYANRRFYSCRSIRRRLSRSPVGLCWTLPLNLAYAFALRYRA
jgi:radical SAM superfamily enzyme YgiQ (UPF0313 family)